MLQLKILTSPKDFAVEFERCCTQYDSLHFGVAWCGTPASLPAYRHIKRLKKQVHATIGIGFCQTHPEGIKSLITAGVKVRIFKDDQSLFHPKIYYFASTHKVAVFIGSSNLTSGGLSQNHEVNVLLEGEVGSFELNQINSLLKTMDEWRSDTFSFNPTNEWIEKYSKNYFDLRLREKKIDAVSEAHTDNELSDASWLENATWRTYYESVVEGLQSNNRNADDFFQVFHAAEQWLPIPWKLEHFDQLEARRVAWGGEQYGAMGNVGASGRFKHLLKNGSPGEKQTLVNTINAIHSLNPIEWKQLESLLNQLIQLGPTMKVWSRIVCLVRPDAYCTISSNRLRKNLSKTLKIPIKNLETVEGYISLLRSLHLSEWFLSDRPENESEAQFWDRRMAFLDAIFY